jgi:DNA (cytosine-5)-methyltransferase 1
MESQNNNEMGTSQLEMEAGSKSNFLPGFVDLAGEGAFSNICSSIGLPKPALPEEFGKALRAFHKAIGNPGIRTLSLFSGAGGLDIGFHDAGFDIVGMVEIEAAFSNSLRENVGPGMYFSEAEVHNIDIREFLADDSQDHLPGWFQEGIDFIIGGPPCQTFSAAGRRASGVLGTSDERGVLFEEYIRLLKMLRPKGFLFENVYGITGAQNGEAFAQITEGFEQAGYRIELRVLDAADYGVPQHRERLFIVGTRKGSYQFPAPTHGPDSSEGLSHISAKEAMAGCRSLRVDQSASVGGQYGGLLEQIPPGLNYSFFTKNMGHPSPRFAWRSKFSDFLYKADPERPIRTLKAQGGQYTGPFHWKNRPFGQAELKRLQTFPDTYKILGGKQVFAKQIGNSVPPQLARILALSIGAQLFDIDVGKKLNLLDKTAQLGFRKRKRSLTKSYREKAEAAIKRIKEQTPNVIESTRFHAKVGEAFALEKGASSGSHPVTVRAGKSVWSLRAGKGGGGIISLLPTEGKGTWDIPVPEIKLYLGTLDNQCFQVTWKALDHCLASYGVKEDLVQLCGYYQYAPSFRCEFGLPDTASAEWRLVKKIVEGVGVGQTIHGKEIAKLLGCKLTAFISLAKHLRKLGFEVRNTNTNPNIPIGEFLIPYSFPTLKPKSVQLRKELFPVSS